MFSTKNVLYIFENEDTIFHALVSGVDLPNDYFTAPCLLDSEANDNPPKMLTGNRRLFILQAASPNAAHIKWAHKRTNVCRFVLNPPDEDEVIKASVFFLFFSIRIYIYIIYRA